MDRRGGAGEVVDLVDFHVQRKGHVVAQQFEVRVVQQMSDVVLGAGEEVVDAEHVVAIRKQTLAQMAAEEAGTAGDEDALAEVVTH